MTVELQSPPRTPATSKAGLDVLYATGLTKDYGGRRVVDHVDVRLERGQIVGLLGPNGAGKTTTFNMIVGILKPLEGKILLDGKDITKLPLHKRARMGLGYLAQEKSSFRKLTVEQNLLAVLETMGMSRADRLDRAADLLRQFGISHKAKHLALTCSGGEARRLDIARALATKPKFMLLDEPFAAIDPKTVEEIQEIIFDLRDAGLGILITDHSVRETLTVTHHSYIIFEGKVEVSGSPEELVNDPEARRLYLGESFYMHFPTEGGGRNPSQRAESAPVDQPVQVPPEDESAGETAQE